MRVRPQKDSQYWTGFASGLFFVGILAVVTKVGLWLYDVTVNQQPVQDFIVWATTDSMSPVEVMFNLIGVGFLVVLVILLLTYPMVGPRP